MPLSVPPVVLPALLLVLLTTQVSYLAAPRAPHYLVRLALSALGVLLGEGISLLGPGARLAVGELHPVTDLVLVIGLQLAGSRFLRRHPV